MALTDSALDIHDPGWDRDSGHGIVMADRALSYDDLFVTPLEDFKSSGPIGGPYTPLSATYTLKNTTDRPIWWKVTNPSSWLNLSSAPAGMLAPGETRGITISINNYAKGLGQGLHKGTIRFSHMTHGSVLHGHVTVTREVRLNVGSGRAQPGVLFLLHSE
jgi:hypothetical protein